MKFFILNLTFLLLMSGCGVDPATVNSLGDQNLNNNDLSQDDSFNDDLFEDDSSDDDGINRKIVIFDKSDAKLDSKACGTFGEFTAIADSTLNPEGFDNRKDGIKITSSLPMSYDPYKSEVTLYYPKLTSDKLGVYSAINKDEYYITFDNVWFNNEKQAIYVRTPRDDDGRYSCYRYVLNSSISSSPKATKVYR